MTVVYIDNESTSGCYPVPVGLMFAKEAWDAEMARLGIDHPWEADANYVQRIVSNDNGSVRVFLCLAAIEGAELGELVDIVAHEATHIWQCIRDYIGEKSPGREQEALAVAWFAKWAFTAAMERRHKPSCPGCPVCASGAEAAQ